MKFRMNQFSDEPSAKSTASVTLDMTAEDMTATEDGAATNTAGAAFAPISRFCRSAAGWTKAIRVAPPCYLEAGRFLFRGGSLEAGRFLDQNPTPKMRLSAQGADPHPQPAFVVEMPKNDASQDGGGQSACASLVAELAFVRTTGPDCVDSGLTRACTRTAPDVSVPPVSATAAIGPARTDSAKTDSAKTDTAKTAAAICLVMPETPKLIVCINNLIRVGRPHQNCSWLCKVQVCCANVTSGVPGRLV